MFPFPFHYHCYYYFVFESAKWKIKVNVSVYGYGYGARNIRNIFSAIYSPAVKQIVSKVLGGGTKRTFNSLTPPR